MTDNFTEDNEPGNTFFETAARIAQGIDSLEARSEILSLTAIKYAEVDRLDLAVDLAVTIGDSYLRDQSLAIIAGKSVELGAGDYADTIANIIEDDSAYAVAIEQMAVAYAEAGAFDKALEVAQQLAESAPALNRIALSYAVQGRPAEALQTAGSIDYPDLKANVLVELAGKALHEERNDDAAELLLEARTAIEEVEFPEQQVSILIALASLNHKSGQKAAAVEMLTQARDLANESQDLARDGQLVQIAGGWAELQRYDEADQVIEEVEHPFQFAHATARIALEHHKAGATAKALELLTDATEVVREEEVYGDQSLRMRESLLAELASCYAFAGHYDEALQIAGGMSTAEEQHRTLAEIAKRCVRSGHNDRVIQVTEMIKDAYARVLVELEIVDAFVASEQLELADHALSRTQTYIATMERPYEKAMALMELAPRLARREQVKEQAGQASRVLFEALTTLSEIDGAYHQSHALINLAGKYQKLGQHPGENEQQVLEEMLHRQER
ncbi:MAG TPA: hypothetical protein VMS31_13360 [Pyrinomonadaceae bacterium]|nr:hypothetical protein [Pyrinomonadaceae bacterium]